jgi:hypothetical protein
MSIVRIQISDKLYAEYRADGEFNGTSKGLVSLLKLARFNVGPQNGNAFIAMVNFMKSNKQLYDGLEISYHLNKKDNRKNRFSSSDKQIIY